MKRFLTLLIAFVMAFCTVSVMSSCGTDDSFKIGVILVGDETEGYTEAHIKGIKEAAETLGIKDSQIKWKYKVEENDDCKEAADDLISQGCSLIISNSYGHQEFMAAAAKENSKVTFIAMTGDFAAVSGLTNFKNAFTDCYQGRYVSGVVAGMKIAELVAGDKLIAKNYDSGIKGQGNIRVGYVGAYNYAEVVSGYTAFYLGIKSIVSNVVMDVQYTSSWFDISAEANAADLLVSKGCVIIGQHADSTGAPSKVEALLKSGKVCYSVGYNIDMLEAAPAAALTSATNDWSVYYEYAFKNAMNGTEIATDWAEGYSSTGKSAVGITTLGPSVATGTAAKVTEIETSIKNGSLKVFDTSKFTVNGVAVTTDLIDTSYYSFATGSKVLKYQGCTVEAVKTEGEVTYITESVIRSAPYFSLRINGITELN